MATILEQAIVIRDETQEHANTPERVGQCLVDIANALAAGPIDMPLDTSFGNDQRPVGTPIWRTWLVTREMFNEGASDQIFAVVANVLGCLVHAAKIDVNWGSYGTPISYVLNFDSEGETLMQGENIFDVRPPMLTPIMSPDDGGDIVFRLVAQSGTLLDAVSGFMNIQISILVSGPATPLGNA